jgi:hypothetical protein
MTPEQVIEHAEKVRRIQQAERELARLDAKIAAGHEQLLKPRDQIAEKLAALRGTS